MSVVLQGLFAMGLGGVAGVALAGLWVRSAHWWVGRRRDRDRD